jgi:hypothetical protein
MFDFFRNWLTAFARILVRPTLSTFTELAEDSTEKFQGLVFWLLVSSLISYSVGYLATRGGLSLPGAFLTIIIVPIGVLIWATCIHVIYQKVFKRKKDFHSELVYVLGCIAVIVLLLNTLVVLLPAIGTYLGYATYLYGLGLAAIAVHSITQLKIWETITTVVVGSLLGLGAVICFVAFIFSLSNTNSRLFGP